MIAKDTINNLTGEIKKDERLNPKPHFNLTKKHHDNVKTPPDLHIALDCMVATNPRPLQSAFKYGKIVIAWKNGA